MAKSACGKCEQVFTSVSSFDMHRVGNYGDPIYKKGNTGEIIGYTKPTRRCLTVEEMIEKGMTRTEKGWWTTGRPFTGRRDEEDEIEEAGEEAAD